MNKKIIIGVILMITGVMWGIVWRLQSTINAHYDNFDPGYYLFLPGIILFLMGLNKQSTASRGLRFIGNLFIFFGCVPFWALGRNIGNLYYAKETVNFGYILNLLIFMGFIGLGAWLLLKAKR